MKTNHYEHNKQTVMESAIIAKAIIRRRGQFQALVVFQKSTRQEFYWLYRLNRPRSPARSWRIVNWFGRTNGTYQDFDSLLAYLLRDGGEVLSKRILRGRTLKSMMQHTEHESIHGDWTPQNLSRAKVDKVNRKYELGRMGRMAALHLHR